MVAFQLGVLVIPSNAPACGPWLPDRLLGDGGSSINTAPEFFFELEMKRIAEAFPSRFRMVHPPKADEGGFDYAKQTSEADLADFEAALKDGSIQPTDPAKAREQHQAVRNYLDDKTANKTTPPGEDFASEFSQYDKAAIAYGQNDSKTARELWLALLQLPPEQRHYRSTWAAYMLGHDALQNKDYDQAIQYFQQTRSLAEKGFADSPGLAAASLGWEALALLNKDQLAPSAKLYLESVNSGDFNNVYSLATIARQLFGISSQSADQTDADAESTATPSPTTQSTPVRLPNRSAEAARDPVLRQLVSAALLAGVLEDYSASNSGGNSKVESWLETLERLKLAKVECAEILGWLAYSNGKFEEASRWLKRADPNLPLSQWLQAKLDFHAGKLDQAIAELGAAVKTFPVVTQLESRDLDGDAEALPDPR
ncbi:MAG: tetratricopeptide repeat protein, partial [Verrucomicrobia bacterium]|nr:tetratricopeptide repeat protein [Verrucomicrobiota bacterium]